MRATALSALFGVLFSVAAAGTALADKRVALVIGNANYVNAPKLINPPNDATAVSVMLETAGFAVELRNDLDGSELRRALRDFSFQTQDADVAVVYFAGHGIEVSNTNFLIPTDAKLDRDIDVDDEAVMLDRVLQVIAPARQLRLVILDACRDNPFTRTMKRTMSTRSIGRGLAKYEPSLSNTLVAFAASPGSTVLDGGGVNSPFTTALVKYIATPGLDLRIAFGSIRDDVLKSTQNKQEPYISGSLGAGTIALVSGAAPDSASLAGGSAATSASIARPAEVDTAARDYEAAAKLNTVEVWDEFLRVHGTGFYAYLARAQRAKLMAAVSPPPPLPQAVAVVPPQTATRTLSRDEPQTRREHRKEPRQARRGGKGDGDTGSSGCATAKRTLRAAVALGFDNRDGVITAVHAKCGR